MNFEGEAFPPIAMIPRKTTNPALVTELHGLFLGSDDFGPWLGKDYPPPKARFIISENGNVIMNNYNAVIDRTLESYSNLGSLDGKDGGGNTTSWVPPPAAAVAAAVAAPPVATQVLTAGTTASPTAPTSALTREPAQVSKGKGKRKGKAAAVQPSKRQWRARPKRGGTKDLNGLTAFDRWAVENPESDSEPEPEAASTANVVRAAPPPRRRGGESASAAANVVAAAAPPAPSAAHLPLRESHAPWPAPMGVSTSMPHQPPVKCVIFTDAHDSRSSNLKSLEHARARGVGIVASCTPNCSRIEQAPDVELFGPTKNRFGKRKRDESKKPPWPGVE
jgi:hypothetical protein